MYGLETCNCFVYLCTHASSFFISYTHNTCLRSYACSHVFPRKKLIINIVKTMSNILSKILRIWKKSRTKLIIYQKIFVVFQKANLFCKVLDVSVGQQLIVANDINLLTLYNCFQHFKVRNARYGGPWPPPLNISVFPYKDIRKSVKT